MYITRVIARGFKRGSFDVALSRANVITGDNFAGKTQIMDAVRLGLIGYLPELGKETRKTLGLASAPLMSVTLEFDTQAVLHREFWWEGDTAKQKSAVPAQLKECNLLGVMLNAEEYFALGPIDRTRYVFANCPVDVITHEAMTKRVVAVAPDFVLADHFPIGDNTPQEEMEVILKSVADYWTNLGRTVLMHQGTINGLTQQRADEDPGIPLATLEDQKGVLTREITDANDRRGRLLGAFTQMATDRRRRGEIEREIQHGAKTREQLVVLKEKLALVEKEAVSIVRVTQETISAAIAKGSKCRAAIDAITNRRATTVQERAKAEATLRALDTATVCPYCGATGEGWKELKRAELMTAIETLIRTLDDLVLSGQEEQVQFGKAVEEHKAIMAEFQRQNGVIAERDQTLAAIAKLEPTLSRYQTLEEEKARLMADDPELTARVEAIQSELNVKNDELRGIDRLIATAAGRANDLQRMATAEKERDAATKLKEAAAAAGKELKLIQAEMVEGAFRPLLEIANNVFRGVLPFELEYRDGEIGARAGGLWRGHKTMSGVERALTYCAIQMALASRSPVKVAVLDEMTKLVSKRVPDFATAVMTAIHRKLLDQVIVIDPERGELYSKIKIAPYEGVFAFNIIAVE